MSNDKSKRRTVVLDGSNIVAQGPSDGNDGNILISAIECYEKLGYRVIPVMKTGTVWWMKNNEEPGHTIIKKMKKSGQLKTFKEGRKISIPFDTTNFCFKSEYGTNRVGWVYSSIYRPRTFSCRIRICNKIC